MWIFEWVGDSVVLMYRDKHWTFAYRVGDVWSLKFVKIEDDWLIHDEQLAYIGYKEDSVRRVSFPTLDSLNSISLEEATKLNLMPNTYWT
ncbi:MAG: hypothetical protein ACI9UA_002653 [Pseudoalteromonas tetraodonis]